jgi:hypothetical protein
MSTSLKLFNDVLGRSLRVQTWYGVCLKLDVLDNSKLLVVPPECVDLLFCYLHIKRVGGGWTFVSKNKATSSPKPRLAPSSRGCPLQQK